MTPEERHPWLAKRGADLEMEIFRCKWYAHEDDVIGGWCVMPVDEAPSQGCFEVASFLSEQIARYIALLHNYRIGKT